MNTCKPSKRQVQYEAQRVQGLKFIKKQAVACLTSLTLLLAIIGLTSCSGFTSAGGGNPGTSGTGVLSASALSVSFGNVSVSANKTQSLSVTNTGTDTVTISQATVTGAGFTVVGGNPSTSIPVGQSSTIQIQFAPQTAGAVTGSISIVSDAANSPLTVALTGTGMESAVTVSPGSINFGNVAVGQSSSKSVQLKNSGNINLVITAATTTGSGFGVSGISFPATLTAGQSISFNVQFAPTTGGGVTGSINFIDNAPDSPQSLPLSGTGTSANTPLTANPGSFAFGSVIVASSSTQTIQLTNSGTTSISISQASITGTGFSISGLTTPLTLAAGQSTSFTAKFAPAATGSVNGTITITSNASNATLTIPLSGTGTQGRLSANPASVNFGSLLTGSSGTVTINLTNTGTASVTITAASASGTAFGMSGLSTPLTLNPGQTSGFSVKFAPTSGGSASGTVSVTSNAPGSPLTIALSGTGVLAQPQLTISPASVSFGNVSVGSNTTQSITLTNPGNAALTISQVAASGTGFSLSGIATPVTLNPGASASFTAKFAPTSAGSAAGSISVTSNAPGSPATIALTGSGTQPQLSANPTSASFGNVTTGTNNSQTITLTNGGSASVTISQATAAGTGFSITGITTPLTIAASKTATFNAVFAPTSAGSASGTISLVSNAPNSPLSISLSGTGVTATTLLGATPTSLSFGNVNLSTNASMTSVLKNNGNSNVTISNVTITGAGFTKSGVSSGLTLTPNQTATLTVTFAPTTAGSVSGSITVTSNATNSPATISLTGTGVQPVSHTVNLSWSASSSSGVMGYNVYRGTVSGGPYSKVNSSLISPTAYGDSTVQSAHTYFYVVTAVDSSNVESADSNQVTAVIP